MKPKADYDCVLKFLVIGDSGVGKTCILLKFCEDSFTNVHLTTIGIDFKLKNIDIGGKKVKLQIWDTAGQERFKTITQNYYKGAMGIILVYSVTERESFDNIQSWMKQITEHADENVCKILLGNKADMPDRQVTKEEGEKFAREFNINFFETSAKTGANIQEAFKSIATDSYNKIRDEPSKQTTQGIKFNGQSQEPVKKKGDCC